MNINLHQQFKGKEMTDTSERLAIQRMLADLRYLPKEKADKIRAILENSTWPYLGIYGKSWYC